MKNEKVFAARLHNQKGAVLVIVALLLVSLIGFAAMAIDIGSVASTKNELQNVADASALAAAAELGDMYANLTYEEQQAFVCDPAPIKDIAKTVGLNNYLSDPAGSKTTTIAEDDIVIGTWDQTRDPAFVATLNQPDAVQTTVRRAEGLNGPLPTLFAKIFNMDSVSLSGTATAALTGQSTAGPGDLPFPVGIPKFRVEGDEDEWCGDDIVFSPPTDLDSCAGWTDLEDDPSVTPNGIEDILDGSVESPEIIAWDSEATFNNGKLNTKVFEAFMLRYYEDGFDIDINGNPRMETVDGEEIPYLFRNHPENFNAGSLANGAGPAVAIYDDGCKKECSAGGVCPETCDHGEQHSSYPPCSGGSGNCTGDLRYDHIWQTTVIVYNSDTCAPNQTYEIIGFSAVEITDVMGPSEKMASGRISCGWVDPGATRGGGGNYGIKGSISGLVQ